MMVAKMSRFLGIASMAAGMLVLALAVNKYGDAALLAGTAAFAGAFALLAIATMQTALGEMAQKLDGIARAMESLERVAGKS